MLVMLGFRLIFRSVIVNQIVFSKQKHLQENVIHLLDLQLKDKTNIIR